MSDTVNINVSLPARQWSAVLELLGSHPYNTVAGLINTIQQQMLSQMKQMEPQRVKSNGEVIEDRAS